MHCGACSLGPQGQHAASVVNHMSALHENAEVKTEAEDSTN